MIKLRKILSELITTKPDVIQFAKDRKYEESWIIPLGESRPSGKDVETYLQRNMFQTIIVEYIWNSQNDDNRFVLTLFLDKNCTLQDPKEFVKISLNIFYNYTDFLSFVEKIDNTIIGRKYLLCEPVDSVNLSVFNHWLSVGPVELWSQGSAYNFEEIQSRIHSRPEIEKTSLYYQGLLFRFNVNGDLNGPFYGIKTPCCIKVNNEWIVDFDKVNKWMRIMLGL